jgi:hypothetical protein
MARSESRGKRKHICKERLSTHASQSSSVLSVHYAYVSSCIVLKSN